jgi:hypothetical protein
MTTKQALIGFYNYNQLNLTEDFESHCVRVYIGCILAPVPNIKARKKYLKFHDLHHIMTEYGIDRVGESEISAWELGSRSCRKPLISVMNLFALSTGFVLEPKRVIRAFYRGCTSKNLYYMSDGMAEFEIDNLNLDEMKVGHLERVAKIRFKLFRQLEFAGYIFFSMIIHVGMLVLGKSLLIAESLKNRLRPAN